VVSHDLPLVVVERPGLVEDLAGDGDLAEVVQLRRDQQPAALLVI